MRKQVEELLADVQSPHGQGGKQREHLVLLLLQRVQREYGYIPREAILPIARQARVPESSVYGVATFYSQFKLSPVGRNVITVCRGTACHVKRSHALLDDLKQFLQIGPGETTPDMQFTVQTVACIGSCALAPAMVVNGKIYGHVTRSKMKKMLDKLAGEEPAADVALAEVPA